MSHRRTLATGVILVLVAMLFPVSAFAAAPVADDDTVTVQEDDGPTTVDVLDGDTDDDGDLLQIVSATDPPHGTVRVASDGLTLTYEPDPNYHGTDGFDYVVSDGTDTDTGSVDVTVTSVNDKPAADNDSATVTEDVTEDVSVLVGDTDPEGDDLTVISSSDGTSGSTTIIDGGTKVRYDPNQDATGADSFEYTISDGNGGEDTATVSITFTAVDDAPDAGDDSASIDEDAGPTPIDVLANDTDVDDPDDSLVVTAVTQGSRGQVSFTSSGVTYIPDANEHGGDTFTYTVSDGSKTDVGTVTVTLGAKNDDPDAVADGYVIDEDVTTVFNVRSNDSDIDGDSLAITDVSDPSSGSASIQSGQVRYDPDQDSNGPDSFTYTISDGHGGTDSATVSVTVTAKNDDPVADDDAFPVLEDAPATSLPVLAGDEDADGDTLEITGRTNGLKGTVAITGGGSGLTYDPFTNQVGTDTFTYTVSDGHGGDDTATVTVEIGGMNDRPNAVNDPSMSVPQNAGAVALDVLANDEDLDGDAFSIASIKPASHGTVTITGSGTGLTYNPSGLFKGTDTFKYTITDGSLTDEATVVVTVVADTTDPVVVAPAERFLGQTVGSTTTKIRLGWSATDAGVGVASYKLQVSTDGGSYKTVKLAKATSTSVDRTLTNGHRYRFRVLATDKEGNASFYAYGPTITPKRYSQEASAVVYVGSWKKTTTSKALGGSTRYATSPSRSATYIFTGYDVGWIATRYTSSGKAQILIDGVLVKTVDLDTSSSAYRKLVFQRHFPTLGAHTLQIRPVGDGRVDIDGFVVLK